MTDRDRLIELIGTVQSIGVKYTHEETASSMGFRENEALADHLLANGVISLPCKFQQKVYVFPTIGNDLLEITEMKCVGFIMSCDSYNANLITDKNKLYQPCFGDFGKTVFLTKDEAEQALKEREGK